jgi:hypothetical protein
MRLAAVRRRGATLILFLLVAFLLVFPKAGTKVADLPLTFGYILLGVVAWAGLAMNVIVGRAHRLTGRRILVLLPLVPFQLVVLASAAANGVESVGFLVSVVVSLALVPVALVWALGPQIDRMDLQLLLKLMRSGVLAVAVYGIFLFFYRPITGHFIEIPYLTVNADDVGTLEDTKHINRGGLFKLISTYNNGNIYGVCILMLLPLYELVQRSLPKRAIVKLSLILTLSRTVWIGLLLYELLSRAYLRRLSVRMVVGLLVVLLFGAIGVDLALDLLHGNCYEAGFQCSMDWSTFLLDPSLGGRAEMFSNPYTFFPSMRFDGITEVVYLSVAAEFGVIGLIAFLAAMLPPVILHAMRKVPRARSRYKRSLALCLWLYLILCWSDGALLYIPVMAFYWFIVALLLSPNFPESPPLPEPIREPVPVSIPEGSVAETGAVMSASTQRATASTEMLRMQTFDGQAK